MIRIARTVASSTMGGNVVTVAEPFAAELALVSFHFVVERSDVILKRVFSFKNSFANVASHRS